MSYGIPSAFGAIEFFDENANTIKEMIYGNKLYTVDGIFIEASSGIPEYTEPNDLKNPNMAVEKKETTNGGHENE